MTTRRLALAGTVSMIAGFAAAASPSFQTPSATGKAPAAKTAETPWCGIHLTKQKPPTASPSAKSVPFAESEPNNSPLGGNPVPLGFGPGEFSEFTITGTIVNPTFSSFTPKAEDDGSIPLAGSAGLVAGGSAAVFATNEIGIQQTNGDFDFYALPLVAGQEVFVQALATTGSGLDTVLAIFDSNGNLVAYNDDINFSGGVTDSQVLFYPTSSETYYACVGGYTSIEDFPPVVPSNPFDSSTGHGIGSTGEYEIYIFQDTILGDHFRFDLEPGDVVSAAFTGSASLVNLQRVGETYLMGSSGPLGLQPPGSPLALSGATVGQVIREAGSYSVGVLGPPGAYSGTLQVTRPGYEAKDYGTKQIIFLDFDGQTVDVTPWTSQPPAMRTLSPLSSFLSAWGLSPGDESAVITAITDTFVDRLRTDIIAGGLNGDFGTTGIAGQIDIEVRNSRDHADPFGQPNVSRIVIGGTIAESGINTVGIAESIDTGNYAHEETALVLLDLLSAPPPNGVSVNSYPLGAGFSKVMAVGRTVGIIAAHEAGHYLGCYHTENFNAANQIMDQGGNPQGTFGVGPDLTYGTGDDIDVVFGIDIYIPNEGFTGIEDTHASIAWGLSTGKQNTPAEPTDVWMLR